MAEKVSSRAQVETQRLKALRESKAIADGQDPDAMLGLCVVAIMKAFLPALAVGAVTQLFLSDPVISTVAFSITEVAGAFFYAQLGQWVASVAVAILDNSKGIDEN